MMDKSLSGFEEKEHTADCKLQVWGQDFPQLLTMAAVGMYALMGLQLEKEPRLERSFRIAFSDPEELLVSFLNELLYYIELEELGFDRFELKINGRELTARVFGSYIASLSKEIKAVTYHNLKIEHSSRGLEAVIVFDV